MVECKNCGKLTENAKFCSRSCSVTQANLGRARNPPKDRFCKKCGTNFRNKSKIYESLFCAECRKEMRITHLTLGEYRQKKSVAGKHASWLHAHVRIMNRNHNKHLTLLPCRKCGYNKHVELCHIKPVASFPDEALLIDVNHINNVIQLCRNCHWEFDNGFLQLSEM